MPTYPTPRTASCLIIGFIEMEEQRLTCNDDVPAETVCKWQAREIYKLNQIIRQKKRVIEKLRNNITILLRDPQIKYELSRDLVLRDCRRQVTELQKELHRVRKSDEKLLQTLLNYKLKYG